MTSIDPQEARARLAEDPSVELGGRSFDDRAVPGTCWVAGQFRLAEGSELVVPQERTRVTISDTAEPLKVAVGVMYTLRTGSAHPPALISPLQSRKFCGVALKADPAGRTLLGVFGEWNAGGHGCCEAFLHVTVPAGVSVVQHAADSALALNLHTSGQAGHTGMEHEIESSATTDGCRCGACSATVRPSYRGEHWYGGSAAVCWEKVPMEPDAAKSASRDMFA